MASHHVIVKYLAMFHELYPTREVTTLTADAWEVACADMTDSGFAWAGDRVLKEPGRTYFPTPNELRSHMRNDAAQHPRLANPDDPVAKSVEDYYARGGVASYRLPDFQPRGPKR